MRRIIDRNSVSITVMVCCAALSGCVERTERLVIAPDGAVHWHVKHETDSLEEMHGGDAVPQLAAAWLVAETSRRDDEGKEHFTLTAEAEFKPGRPLPANYAAPTDADADLYLQFPTQVWIERRSDGLYYHFTRTYQPRAWAPVAALQKRYLDVPMEELKDTEPVQWSPADRVKAVRSLAEFEARKALHFARLAFLKITPDAAPDRWLGVQREVLIAVEQLDYATVARLLEPRENVLDEENVQAAIDAATTRFHEKLMERLKGAVRTAGGYDGTQSSNFMAEYDRQRKEYEVTVDLADDKFNISVEMPGVIVASNADQAIGSTASWQLSGEMFRDCTVELMATSRVSR